VRVGGFGVCVRREFDGVIVASGRSGERTVVSSVVIARGVFTGVGRIVEVAGQPGDPDNVVRDDFVFAAGNIHTVTTNLDLTFNVDPRSCVFHARLQQTAMAVGGSGRFAAASGRFSSIVTAVGIAPRNADGSCSEERAPVIEVDTLAATGTLSF
jgi:hypothetical protein